MRLVKESNSDRQILMVIDGFNVIFRAYHALPHLSTLDGIPTNAVYGFVTMLQKIMTEYAPDYLAIAFDTKKNNRRDIYPEYKANRKPIPEDLPPQLPYIRKVAEAFQVPIIEEEGYEADDIIGTLVRWAEEYSKGLNVHIVSSDKDLMQLIRPGVLIVDTMKDKISGAEEVHDKFGVPPSKVVDVMGLWGDSSDNVPGVPGVGEKTAKELIQLFGSIDGVYENIDKVKGKKRKENLEKFEEQARLSKQLVTIDKHVPIEQFINTEMLRVKSPDKEKITALFKELEFNSLLKKMEFEKGDD